MRKLVAVICVVALMTAFAVPAMANPSIGALTESAIAIEALSTIANGWEIVVEAVNPELLKVDEVKEVVTKANAPETGMTVKEIIEKLASMLPEQTRLNEDGTVTISTAEGEKTIDPAKFDFVTEFISIVLTDGATEKFSDNGEKIAARVTMAINALQGETNLEGYMILLINPDNGEVYFIELDSESFNAETGEITVDFPCLGAFALIQE